MQEQSHITTNSSSGSDSDGSDGSGGLLTVSPMKMICTLISLALSPAHTSISWLAPENCSTAYSVGT